MHNHLLTALQKRIDLTPSECELITSYFKPKKYRKHQYILQEGEVCRMETFIVSGCTRTYEIDDKGQEHVLQFGMEGWWVGNMYSFLSETESDINIDCLQDTEVLQITKSNLEELYDRVPKMERYFRILVQNAYIAAMNRISSNLTLSALERYREFISRYPAIEQLVPNHQIASYLGITPQSLSRVRSQNVKAR